MWAKLGVLGVMAVIAVMILTAALTMIAPYVAALLVLVSVGWILLKLLPEDDHCPQNDPPE